MPVAELKKGALTLAGFLDALRDEGKITEADCATALRSSQAAEHQGKHILEILADSEFVDLQDNGRPLDVEQLTMALARQSGQPYYRIDPLKVDVAQSDGCLECRETGFVGREGIYEVLPFTESLFRFADDKADLPGLRRQAYKEGMLSLRLSGAHKVASGLTTINEVLRVTPDMQE